MAESKLGEYITYLHCKICSLGGQHPGDHSKVAIVDMVKIRFPIDPLMFLPLYPDRIKSGPWFANCSFDRMLCPRCRNPIWALNEDQIKEAKEKGGPDEILISEESQSDVRYRLAKVDEYGIVPEGGRGSQRDVWLHRARKMMDLYATGMTLKDLAELFDVSNEEHVRRTLLTFFPEEYRKIANTRPRTFKEMNEARARKKEKQEEDQTNAT